MSRRKQRKRAWKRLLQLLLWLGVLLLLWWTLRQIDIISLQQVLSRLSMLDVVLLLGVNMFVLATFSGRWWSILRGQQVGIAYGRLVLFRLMAASVSYFTPGPHVGGEPVQVMLLQKYADADTATAVGSVTLDKLFELLINTLMLTVGCMVLIQVGVFDEIGPLSLLLPLALLALPVVVLLFLRAGQRPVSRIFGWIPQRLERHDIVSVTKNVVADSENQIHALWQARGMAIPLALFFSLISWCGIVFEYWFALNLLGLPLSFVELILIITAGRLAILLPSPGGLGTFEASQVLIFGALGYAPEAALALSLLVRARDLLFMGIGLLLTARTLQTNERNLWTYFRKHPIHE